jgi:hypothetical protein
MLRFSRLVLFVLAATCGTFANAESPEETATEPRGARRLFALPSGELSVEEALRVVEEEELRLTASEEERLQMDVAILSKGARLDGFDPALPTFGILVEKNDDAYSLVVRDDRGAPIAIRRSAHAFWLDRPGEWRHVSHEAWCFFVDAGHFQSNDVSKLTPGESHDIVIELSNFLTTMIRRNAENALWDSRARLLYLSKPGDKPIAIRFRSPDDQLRYGSVWAQIFVPDGPTYLVLGGFARRSEDLFTAARNADEIGQSIVATEADVFPRDWTKIRTKAPKQDAAALAMEATLASDAYRRPEIIVAREGIQTAYRAILAYEKDDHDPEKDFVPVAPADAELVTDADQSAGVEERLRTTIFEAELKFDAAEAATLVPFLAKTLGDLADAVASDLEGYPDDPSMIWREAEARYGSMRLHHFLRIFVSKFLFDDDGTPTRDLRACLCDALLDLGEPPTMKFEARWKKLRTDSFIDALLRAQRQEAIDDECREACLAELRAAEAGSPLENLAVEVLLRIGERPPEEKSAAVDRWWRSEVVEASRGRRLRSLVVLSGCAFGREMILKRLREEDLPDDVRSDVVRALTSRIDAAEQTGRDEEIDAAQREAWRKELAELDVSSSDDGKTTVVEE